MPRPGNGQRTTPALSLGASLSVGKSGTAYPSRRGLAVGPQSMLGLGSAVCQLGVPSGHMALF